MLITSRQNPKVKELIALRERKTRQETGVVLVDGFAELQLAIKAGVKLQTLFYCAELMGAGQGAELERLLATGIESYELNRDVFEKVSYREGPDGWLAIASSPQTQLDQLKLGDNPVVLVCEAVEKPGNLGAMLRTADAVGAAAVIAVDSKTDWGNPNIIRASKGTVFSVPVVDASRDELAAWLKANKLSIVAATPAAEQVYTQAKLDGALAILVGTENTGLSDFWLNLADQKVRIPMRGQIDSLNVATSAAILLYEALRQRGSV